MSELFFYPTSDCGTIKGPDLKKTHIVQSYRSAVERAIGALKLFLVLQGGQCDNIVLREKELDVCMALQNLIQMHREGTMDRIPVKAPCLPDAHIITPSEIKIPKFPAETKMTDQDFPVHLRRFRKFLTFHAGTIREWLFDASRNQIFSNRQEMRGRNLVQGANILQIRVHERREGVWLVRGTVGASMRGCSYVSCAELTHGTNDFWVRCECKSG